MNKSVADRGTYMDKTKFKNFDEKNGFMSMAQGSYNSFASNQPSGLFVNSVNRRSVFTKYEMENSM